jgi:hypothetical protein
MKSVSSGPGHLPLKRRFEVLQVMFAYPIDIVAHGDGRGDVVS